MTAKGEGYPWKVTVYAGIGPDGKQRQLVKRGFAATEHKATEARKAARQKLIDKVKENGVASGTVAELCGEWTRAKSRSKAASTVYREASIIKRIVESLGHIRLSRLTARDLDRFYAALLDAKLSPSTVNHDHRVIHGMLRQALKWGMVNSNVADLATPPRKAANGAHTMPTHEALRALIRTASPDLAMAASLAAATGARRGELIGLLWSDLWYDSDVSPADPVDPDYDETDDWVAQLAIRRSITQIPGQPLAEKPPKSGRERTISVDKRLVYALESYRESQRRATVMAKCTPVDDGPILADLRIDPSGATPYAPDWLTRAWARHCTASKVKFRFHDLRHFHASTLIDAGIPLSMVSERIGHLQMSTTSDIYAHALKPSDIRAAQVIGEIMAGSS